MRLRPSTSALLGISFTILAIRLAPSIRRFIVSPVLSDDDSFTVALAVIVGTCSALYTLRLAHRAGFLQPRAGWELPGHTATMLLITARYGVDLARYIASTSSPSTSDHDLRVRARNESRSIRTPTADYQSKEQAAKHEAAHAIVALALGRVVVSISITSRDHLRYTGRTEHLSIEPDQRERARIDLRVALAGSVEDMRCGAPSTCSVDDLQDAVRADAELTSLGDGEDMETARRMDGMLLSENQHALESIAAALCREGSLGGWKVRAIVMEHDLTAGA